MIGELEGTISHTLPLCAPLAASVDYNLKLQRTTHSYQRGQFTGVFKRSQLNLLPRSTFNNYQFFVIK